MIVHQADRSSKASSYLNDLNSGQARYTAHLTSHAVKLNAIHGATFEHLREFYHPLKLRPMKRTAFHINALNLRGVAVSAFDYAHYNETILGNRSFILSRKGADNAALKKFEDRFEVFLYRDFHECQDYVQSNDIDGVYFQKEGSSKDGLLLPGVRNYIHAVFQVNDPHGDSYQYISSWLAQRMGRPDEYVPYIVQLPEPMQNLRSDWGFDDNTLIIGRHGGWTQFNLEFVHQAIYDTLRRRGDVAFVFMNTKPFGPTHKNIVFLEPTYDLQAKTDFIYSCDYMIHARRRGESFGLAVCEFLFHDKPVISWNGGTDRAHIDILSSRGLLYNDYNEITSLLGSIDRIIRPTGEYEEAVVQFSPRSVMTRFAQRFYGI